MTIPVVSPLMIGTDEAFDMALGFLADDGTAVTADIVKSLYPPIVLANDDQRVVIHVVEKVVSRVWDLAAVTRK